MDELSRIHAAAERIRKSFKAAPEVAVILGTGLGDAANLVAEPVEVPFADIPHFPKPTAVGHAGHLTAGRIGGRHVLVWEGRFHLYEGYPLRDVVLPVRVSRALGATTLIVSNACGGMNPRFDKGDIVIIEDHISLLGPNPLIGPNDDSLGPRFPDMSEPYSRELIRLAEAIALEERIRAHRGVYVYVTGPTLETRAEYRMLRTLGADVVGMSTVPEVIAAVHASMKVLGLSCVTDMCLPDALAPANIEEIIRVANEAGPKLTKIIERVIKEMPK
ncbi:MAG: purine-nucleoside phosphorylase [Planctomycetota bacterium]